MNESIWKQSKSDDTNVYDDDQWDEDWRMRSENVRIERDSDENDTRAEQRHYRFKRHENIVNRVKNAFDKEVKIYNDNYWSDDLEDK